jgi:hypothetical protein
LTAFNPRFNRKFNRRFNRRSNRRSTADPTADPTGDFTGIRIRAPGFTPTRSGSRLYRPINRSFTGRIYLAEFPLFAASATPLILLFPALPSQSKFPSGGRIRAQRVD